MIDIMMCLRYVCYWIILRLLCYDVDQIQNQIRKSTHKTITSKILFLLLECPLSRRQRNALGWRGKSLKDLLFGDQYTPTSVVDFAEIALNWNHRC
jgi:hypothetical protein